jgi:hypothetical protein
VSIKGQSTFGFDDLGSASETVKLWLEIMKRYDDWDLVTGMLGPNYDAPSVDLGDLSLNFNDLRLVEYTLSLHREVLKRGTAVRNILSIGAGYGGMEDKLARLYPQSMITIIDLPEMLALSKEYIKTCALKNGYSEDKFEFISHTHYSTISKSKNWDVVINVRSFVEMPLSASRQYIDFIDRRLEKNGFVFVVSALQKRDLDGEITEILKILPDRRRIEVEKVSIQPDYFYFKYDTGLGEILGLDIK